ncbi:MAG: ATP synthase F1 subunit gamma [Phycisphaerae bacterium]|nr:ATP synthase F1 subunit gamma [Phycisphaerae bacterium]
MAKARAILKRVKAVKSIRTVTKTMEMVATARYRKNHQLVTAIKPYVDRLAGTVRHLVARGSLAEAEHPLLRAESSAKRQVLLVITSNRGLAGSYNSGVLRMATQRHRQLTSEGYEVPLHVVGKRGIQFMRFRRHALENSYTQFDNVPAYELVREIADDFIERFTAGEISGVEVAYTQFVSTGKQIPVIAPVLPLSDINASPGAAVPAEAGHQPSYELIPSAKELFERLLPLTVRMKIFQCFLDAAVSEQMMRITAMRSATDSADEMIHDLTVQYNRSRQAQITTELAEIMGGSAGLGT